MTLLEKNLEIKIDIRQLATICLNRVFFTLTSIENLNASILVELFGTIKNSREFIGFSQRQPSFHDFHGIYHGLRYASSKRAG